MSHFDLGPLEVLLKDGAVTTIHISGEGIRYEKGGIMHFSDLHFESDSQRWQIVMNILAAGGTQLSASHPSADCVLTDGTQVHAEYEPLLLSLRKSE